MDTPKKKPTPFTDPAVFRDLRARNERRQALRLAHAERKKRIERVIEATRYRARSAFSAHHGRSGGDRS